MACVWKSENNFWVLVLSFHALGFGTERRSKVSVVKCLVLLNYLSTLVEGLTGLRQPLRKPVREAV